jgi:hypothetical protein
MHGQPETNTLISSITSRRFRKVIFTPSPIITLGDLLGNRFLGAFEDVICGLADRLRASGSRHTLEVEFWVASVDYAEEEYGWILPKFQERGRVRVCGRAQE